MRAQRVGIVTIIDNSNFGNRLQNYALQQCLSSQGWMVETIPNTPTPMGRRLVAERALTAVRAEGPWAVGRRNIPRALERLRNHGAPPTPQESVHESAIRMFTCDRITQLDLDEVTSGATGLTDRYEKVVVGSDQVWNPGFRQANEIDFLTFVPCDRRVAYAASFGVREIPEFLRSRYSHWLSEIPHISVREHSGADIVKDLTGRHVPVVSDPTVLVDPGLWDQESTVPTVLEGRRYVAKFFLGEETPLQEAELARFAASEGLELIDLKTGSIPGSEGLSPLEFIGAIRNADVVATDSFHAGVFSVIFERETITKRRQTDDTRLDTLFRIAGIRATQPGRTDMSIARNIDWGRVRDCLAAQRAHSWDFLERAIGRPAPVGAS